MSEEEKKAIDELWRFDCCYNKEIKAVLNLIEKQQKEPNNIKELEKQDKMIELMALALAETEFDKCCDYCNTDICTAHEDIDERAVCVKIYFENKAEESK